MIPPRTTLQIEKPWSLPEMDVILQEAKTLKVKCDPENIKVRYIDDSDEDFSDLDDFECIDFNDN